LGRGLADWPPPTAAVVVPPTSGSGDLQAQASPSPKRETAMTDTNLCPFTRRGYHGRGYVGQGFMARVRVRVYARKSVHDIDNSFTSLVYSQRPTRGAEVRGNRAANF
jgi:hypothetical protein